MTPDIQRHHTSPRMSKIVQFGQLVFLCGQTSSGAPMTDIVGQTQEVLRRIDALLQEAGTERGHILSATIHLKSITDFAAMNTCWEHWLDNQAAPARTTVQATLALDNLLVEITVIAAS